MNFSTKVANTTTGTATLNINGLGAKNIYDEYNTLLPAKVLQAGQIYTFVYNSSLNSGAGGLILMWRMLSLNHMQQQRTTLEQLLVPNLLI